jgi:hypothetical protein
MAWQAGQRRQAAAAAGRRAAAIVGQLLGRHQRAGGGVLLARDGGAAFAHRPVALAAGTICGGSRRWPGRSRAGGTGAGAGLRHRRAGRGEGGAGALGADKAGTLVEAALARIALGLVAAGRGTTGGGRWRTSGACVQALGITQLRIGPQIDPGVPWCHAATGASRGAAPGVEVGQLRRHRLLRQGLRAAVSDEAFAREEICRVGRSLFERGYVHATAGNISVRLDDGFLITPTDACLGQLDPNGWPASTRRAHRPAATAPARRWRCTAHLRGRRPSTLRHPHPQHAPGGADAAGRVERATTSCRRSRPTS